MLSERVLAQWWRLVAFMKATNLLHRVMRAVSHRPIATAIKMTSKGGGGIFLIVVLIVPLAAAGAIRSE